MKRKERKGKERKGKERKGKERKGNETKRNETNETWSLFLCMSSHFIRFVLIQDKRLPNNVPLSNEM